MSQSIYASCILWEVHFAIPIIKVTFQNMSTQEGIEHVLQASIRKVK